MQVNRIDTRFVVPDFTIDSQNVNRSTIRSGVGYSIRDLTSLKAEKVRVPQCVM